MKHRNTSKPHFVRWDTIPHIPEILSVLKQNWLIDQAILIEWDKWLYNVEEIKNSLSNSTYKNVILQFNIQLKITFEDSLWSLEDEFLNPIQESNRDYFKNIVLKTRQMKQLSWKVITEALSINKNILSPEQAIIIPWIEWIDQIENILSTLKKIIDLTQRKERINSRIRINERNQYRIYPNDERHRPFDWSAENNEFETEKRQLTEDLEKQAKIVSTIENKLNFEELNVKINNYYNQETSPIWIISDIFVPSFYQRINIIETWVVRQNELVKLLNSSKTSKQILSNKFLWAGIIFLIIILVLNICLYILNFDRYLVPYEFVKMFLGHGFYLAIFEIILFSSAIISYMQFRLYSKIVEIYDTYIFIVSSDSSYKDDDQFLPNDPEWQRRLFEMRKENTQKIHTLPEKTYSLLCSSKASDDLPQLKLLEELVAIIKKVKE